ncbi:MAG: hypothetical protein M9962_08525 [Oligoflexia bacterium]|nr:hypothetical protein [Oligoflexia bacterium]
MDVKTILSLRVPQLLEKAADHSKLARLSDAEDAIQEILRQWSLYESEVETTFKIFLEAWLEEVQNCKDLTQETEEDESVDVSSLLPWANAAYKIAKRIKDESDQSTLLQGIWKVRYPSILPILRLGLVLCGVLAIPIGLGIFLWIIYNLLFGFSDSFTQSGPEPFRQGILLFLRIMGGLAWSICLQFFGYKWLQKGISGKNLEQPIYEFNQEKGTDSPN